MLRPSFSALQNSPAMAKLNGCGCSSNPYDPVLYGNEVYEKGNLMYLVGPPFSSLGGAVPQVKKLSPALWRQVQEKLVKTGLHKDAQCVIMSWVGGVPESSFDKLGQSAKATFIDAGWWNFIPVVAVGSQLGNLAGEAYQYAKVGKIYTLADACPGGPTIDVALASLMNPIGGDPVLGLEIVKLATGHRANLVKQVVGNTQQHRKKLAADAAEYAYDAVTGAIKNTIGFKGMYALTGIAATVGVVLGIGLAIGGYFYLTKGKGK